MATKKRLLSSDPDGFDLPGVEDDSDLPPIPRKLAKLLADERKGNPGRGRPSALTPRKVRRLLFALRSAASIRACAEWSGLGWSTYRRAFTEGGKEGASPLLAEFRASCARARESGELELVRIIQLHAPRDWRAAAALLEAKKPKRYRRQVAVDANHGGAVTVKGLGEAFADLFADGSTKGGDDHA